MTDTLQLIRNGFKQHFHNVKVSLLFCLLSKTQHFNEHKYFYAYKYLTQKPNKINCSYESNNSSKWAVNSSEWAVELLEYDFNKIERVNKVWVNSYELNNSGELCGEIVEYNFERIEPVKKIV